MSQQQLLAQVVNARESAKIQYMLVGSVVSSFQGEPRSTHDIDIVVKISIDQVSEITSAFDSKDYAFDDVAARDAVARGDMFQLMDFISGDKIDFWILKTEPFDQSAFSRRYRDTVAGVQAYLPQPEDTILQKLKWAHEYESEKQFRDAKSVYELQFVKLDMSYLRNWVQRLKIDKTWETLLAKSQPLQQ